MTESSVVRIVLVWDDPSESTQLLPTLREDDSIHVIGVAHDHESASQLISRHSPQLVLLSWETEKLDGLDLIRWVMEDKPCPILVCSSQASRSAAALSAGAVDFVPRMAKGSVLRAWIRLFSKTKVVTQHVRGHRTPCLPSSAACSIIGIGASAGGPVALRRILSEFKKPLPPIVIVQHVFSGFAASTAEWLSTSSGYPTRVAAAGEILQYNQAYLAPDLFHLRVGPGLAVVLEEGPPVHAVIPAIDLFFDSLASHYRAKAIGVLLTGMGKDGAAGLLKMRRSGSHTLVQSVATSMIDGMPKAARDLGAAEWVVPLDEMAKAIEDLANANS